MHEVVVAKDREAVAELAAGFIAKIAGRYEDSTFNLSLSGGRTPVLLYEKLAAEPLIEELPWKNTHIWWGDERVVGPDDPASNYRMARESLLERVPVPDGQIHRIRGELGAEEAASRYRDELLQNLGTQPRFNLCVLGVGADGHTASIFPEHFKKLKIGEPVAVTYGGVPEVERVTITFDLINACDQIAVLAQGKDKAEIMQRILMGDPTVPASHIEPIGGEERLHFFLDSEAASLLDKGG